MRPRLLFAVPQVQPQAPAAGLAAAGAALTKTGDVPVGSGVIVGKTVVTQPTAGEFKAFSAVCTHSGCLVNKVADGTIDCPCHGSKFSLDGQVVNDLDTRVLMVALGNGSSVGGGTELTPDADPEDGRIDLMVSRATGPLARLLYAARLGIGTHEQADDVTALRGREVSVSGEEFWISADGEIYGPERHRTWHIEPAAYSMVLPVG